MQNDDFIIITYLPPCINVPSYISNPYIGMSGIVKDFDGENFSLFTGTSWLVGANIKTCKYKTLKLYSELC